MLKEITLPSGYTGTLEQENDVIGAINHNFIEIEKKIDALPDKTMFFDSHIIDFEEYEMDIYFSDNKTKANIRIDDDYLVVSIGENEVRIDRDGNVV